jgi:hypothetical protein
MADHKNKGKQEDDTTTLKTIIMNQIKHVLEGDVLKDFNNKPASSLKTHTFLQIMGSESAGYWWRLYIDPKDWDKAEEDAADHGRTPGELYDNQESKGWKVAMTATYQKYLVHPSLEEFLGDIHKPFTWEIYLGIWTDASYNVETKNTDGFYDRVTTTDKKTTFGCPQLISQDTLNQKIDNKPLVHILTLENQEPDFKLGYVSRRLNEDRYIVVGGGSSLDVAVQEVFKLFCTEMSQATLRKHQLRAIARVIRNLHIMHTFSDGCGRVNIQTLLPAMLLKYGFGLPLGGSKGAGVTRMAQYFMFNGGFSLDEITQWLWVTQDFGLTGPDHETSLKRYIISQPSHTGTTGGHPPPGPGNGNPPSGGNAHPPLGGNTHPPSGGNTHPPSGGNAHPPSSGNTQPPPGGKSHSTGTNLPPVGKSHPTRTNLPPGGKAQPTGMPSSNNKKPTPRPTTLTHINSSGPLH